MADRYEMQDCGRCGGVGNFGPRFVQGGICFACHGRKKVRVNLSARQRRETALVRRAERAKANLAAFIAANPELAMVADFHVGFIGQMRGALMERGSLSVAQTEALKAAVVREQEFARQCKAREERLAQSQFQGSVGQKITASVTILFERKIESQFGVTTLYGMEDEAGNQYRWFSSSYKVELAKGDKVEISGSVKKHDEYQGVKQTVLTRCKVVDKEQERVAA